MPPPRCLLCPSPSSLRRPRTGDPLCRRCFLAAFEDETHRVIAADLTRPAHDVITTPFTPPSPRPGQSVAVAVSGGKDSAVLAHLLGCLERRHGYGLRASLLAVDEGIAGYREASLGAVRRGRGGLPLLLLSHRDAFGWSVDELGEGLGAASRCTYCGVLRRRALEAGARAMGVDWIATGHNADDIAETVLMNFLRGDVARLRRVASEASGTPGTPWNPPGTPTTSMETSRNPLETPRNPLETPRSSMETPRNPLETSRNPPGTPRNPLETSRNPPGTPRNPLETPTTSMETSRSPLETPRNPLETPRKPLETPTSSIEISRNPLENPLETPRSSMETSGNPPETPKSSTETPKSSMESTKNPQETPRSSMGTPKSSMETTKNPPETPRSSTETPTTSTKPPRSPPQPPKNLSKPHPRPPKATGDPRGGPEVAPLPSIPRWKPLRHAYEKEIVLYAYYQGLDYVSTECVYAPQAYRGHARDLLKDLEATRPSTVAALGHSGRRLAVATEVATKTLGTCGRCGYGASQALCKVCVLLAALEKGRPKVGLGKRSLEMAWEERGGQGGGGYGGGGHGDGGHGGDGCGGGGHGVGDHGDGGHGADCHGAGGRGDGGHGDEHHGAGSHGDGAGGHGDGGHGAGGHGVGGHGGDECGDGGPSPGAGGHRVCSCRAGGRGAGGPAGSWRRAGGTGDGEGEGVEVEVVGAGGRTVRRRFLGFGRVHGALNIWDF